MERLVTASGYEGVLRNKSVRPELVGRLGRCGHMYHLLCLVAMYSNGNKVGHKVGCPACSGWVPGSELGSGWGPGGTPGASDQHALPRMAACSAPPAKPSMGRRQGRSRQGRWSFMSSHTHCPASQTPRPYASSMISPRASRSALQTTAPTL